MAVLYYLSLPQAFPAAPNVRESGIRCALPLSPRTTGLKRAPVIQLEQKKSRIDDGQKGERNAKVASGCRGGANHRCPARAPGDRSPDRTRTGPSTPGQLSSRATSCHRGPKPRHCHQNLAWAKEGFGSRV